MRLHVIYRYFIYNRIKNQKLYLSLNVLNYKISIKTEHQLKFKFDLNWVALGVALLQFKSLQNLNTSL